MKHLCEGYSGWWRGDCPQPVFVLEPGQAFTPYQLNLMNDIGTVVVVLMLLGLAALLGAAVVSMLGD